jgi:magnesium-transporting ATPase (P-type)
MPMSQTDGLTDQQVQERVDRGQTNTATERTSRTVGSIVRANVITRFNAILGTLLAVIVVIGPLQDALFGGVLVANTLVGIIQELRAKRSLDRLVVLSVPMAHVVRSGRTMEVPVAEVVLDDVLEFRPGDQVIADGLVLTATDLELDEALVSGEAAPVTKVAGDPALSGSFVVAGSGRYRATGVGDAAYAQKLASAAKRFKPAHSELRTGINRILRFVTWAIAVAAPLLLWSQMRAQSSLLPNALRSTVAGIVPMVPEGLVLLTSVALAVAVTRLGQRQALIQELPAVETLARVTTLCFDKTGTLTTGEPVVEAIDMLDDGADVAGALGALAAADPMPNSTLRAIAGRYPASVGPGAGWKATHIAAFSSARKWSGAAFGVRGNWLLGAPDVLLAEGRHAELLARASAQAGAGRRVLLLAHAGVLPEHGLPPDLTPAALVIMAEQLRPDAADTLAFFQSQGIALKVISGDHPQTVAAVARQVGIPGADTPVDARELPSDKAALAAVMESQSVFGRASPDGKQLMLAALQSRGHVVAMTGDGVNDVLALKQADIGIAMGSGSGAARAVAQLTLLDGNFASLPQVLAEGRRAIANVERLAILFVTKTVYAAILVFIVEATGLVYPFLPRQMTLIGTLTIGVPAFFLALAPNAQRARPGFVTRVLRFAAPAGVIASATTLAAYSIALYDLGSTLDQARTVTTIVLLSMGLVVLAVLSRPATLLRVLVLGGMTAASAVVMAVPVIRSFFALVPLCFTLWSLAAVIVVPAAAILIFLQRRLQRDPGEKFVPVLQPAIAPGDRV